MTLLTPSPMSRNVLIVDDDPTVAIGYRAAFEGRGFRVQAAKNLAELGEMVSRTRFDVALVDVYLGNENGLDGLKTIEAKAPSTKVVVFSGRSTVPVAVRAMHAGADFFLGKETSMDDLVAQVEQLLSPSDSTKPEAFSDARATFEKAYLERVLTMANGNLAEAARLSGEHRTQLYRLVERYGIDVESFRK